MGECWFGERSWTALSGRWKTKYSQSGLPLDPALAEVLFAWKRASAFGQEADWVFASSLKAGEVPLRSSKMLANEIKPAGRRHRLADVSPHLLLHVASTRSRRESSARTITPRRL
jgi:hypothetical protein